MSLRIPGKLIGLILGPLLFVILRFSVSEVAVSELAPKVFGIAAWMLTWWVMEAVPISVTALLPLVLFPFLGVMNVGEAASNYANPVIFLFMGGFMIALALEKHRLHERIALSLVRITGTSGNGIIGGFMIATAFTSMWISNTATAMMMLPIATSVIGLLRTDKNLLPYELPKGERNFALGLMLAVGYAASLGGMATLIGTPPNVVFKGLLEKFYDQQIPFAEWMAFGIPVSVILLLSTYLIVTSILFPNGIKKVSGSEEFIRIKLKELGPMSREEKTVLTIFLLTSIGWILQAPLNRLLGSEVLNDTNVGMSGGILMFITPVHMKKPGFLLEWDDTRKMAWGILLLFGGGLCLADGLETAGIIQAFGGWIAENSAFNIWLLLVLIVISVTLTELMSNVALVNIFIPVVFGIANGLGASPLVLGIPVTLAASICFMLPIATPPNAIVFSSGFIRMKDMVRAGLLLNIVSIVVLWVLAVVLLKVLL